MVARTTARAQADPSLPEAGLDLHLINGFEFFGDGQPIFFPLSVQRLLAFLALSDRPLQRLYVACKLWIDTTEERAFANLPSTLWRAIAPAIGWSPSPALSLLSPRRCP